VLAVDDERPTRLLMERELPRAGFRVTTAESGEEALAAVRTQDFDVILLDLRMRASGAWRPSGAFGSPKRPPRW
jgi:CheY-like chemotaxis protein